MCPSYWLRVEEEEDMPEFECALLGEEEDPVGADQEEG